MYVCRRECSHAPFSASSPRPAWRPACATAPRTPPRAPLLAHVRAALCVRVLTRMLAGFSSATHPVQGCQPRLGKSGGQRMRGGLPAVAALFRRFLAPRGAAATASGVRPVCPGGTRGVALPAGWQLVASRAPSASAAAWLGGGGPATAARPTQTSTRVFASSSSAAMASASSPTPPPPPGGAAGKVSVLVEGGQGWGKPSLFNVRTPL